MVSIQRCAPFALIFHVSSAMCSCWYAAWRLAARMYAANTCVPRDTPWEDHASSAQTGSTRQAFNEAEGEAMLSAAVGQSNLVSDFLLNSQIDFSVP